MSTRFYCPELAENGRLQLDGDEARHLARVCRFGVGDIVELFDGCGHATQAEVRSIRDGSVELVAIGDAIPARRAPLALTLATAVPKGDRFDWLVEKVTELGVESLVPLVTERSVVEPGEPKLQRLRRSIIEAAKQCGRNRLMTLEAPVPWSRFAGAAPQALKLLADPGGSSPAHWPALAIGRQVILAVGPEGGFTPSEAALADHRHWIPISLSANTLRIETAGIAGCASLFSMTQKLP